LWDTRGAHRAGPGQFERARDATRERLEPVAAAGWSLPRWRRWMLFVLLGGFVLAMISIFGGEEQPQTKGSPDAHQPTGDATTPNAPRAGAANPAPSPQAGPEAARRRPLRRRSWGLSARPSSIRCGGPTSAIGTSSGMTRSRPSPAGRPHGPVLARS